MAIDKALNQAPLGLDPMMGESMEPDIEIEIEDPESVGITAGGMEIMIEPGADIESEEFNANLAEDIPDDILAEIAGDLISEYEEDVSSRKDWMQTYVDGLELLGMKIEERSEPWEGGLWRIPSVAFRGSGQVPERDDHGDFPGCWPG